jgi:RAQPRD family integrative conjugative element protein
MVFTAALAAVLLAVGSSAPPAVAQPAESERELLARLANELSVLERLVYEAEQRAQSGDRVLFDYRSLRADLQGIRDGVRSYVTEIRPQPRIPAPLDGEYVRAGVGE